MKAADAPGRVQDGTQAECFGDVEDQIGIAFVDVDADELGCHGEEADGAGPRFGFVDGRRPGFAGRGFGGGKGDESRASPSQIAEVGLGDVAQMCYDPFALMPLPGRRKLLMMRIDRSFFFMRTGSRLYLCIFSDPVAESDL